MERKGVLEASQLAEYTNDSMLYTGLYGTQIFFSNFKRGTLENHGMP